MLDLEILRDERESGFNNWFDKWWSEVDIENMIVDRNAAGYTWLNLGLTNIEDSDYTVNRFRDPLFLERLRSELPGFNCTVINVLINTLKLRISWAEEDRERTEF